MRLFPEYAFDELGEPIGALRGSSWPSPARIYENMPNVQGLHWMSRRDNERSCVMLFRDCIDPASLATVGSWPIEQFEGAVFDVLELLGAGLA